MTGKVDNIESGGQLSTSKISCGMRSNQAHSNDKSLWSETRIYELIMEPFELSELEVKVTGIFIKRGCLNDLTLHYQNPEPLVFILIFLVGFSLTLIVKQESNNSSQKP